MKEVFSTAVMGLVSTIDYIININIQDSVKKI